MPGTAHTCDDTVPPDLDAWRGEMADASRTIEAFLQGSETVFLDVGARLGGLQERARQLLHAANAAAALQSDAGKEGPVARLRGELARMDRYLHATREAATAGASNLAQLLTLAESVQRTHSHLESIPPTLRMLGLNTRIENARSGAANAGMESVAAEVRRLGELVEPKFRGVFQHASTLLETAKAAQGAGAAFLQRQGAASGDMLRETEVALEALRALAEAEAGVASRAATASRSLTEEMTAVVVALQGHDATRQVLQHVQESLQSILAELDTGEASMPQAAGALLSRVPELCRVLSAQVAGARQRFTGALQSLTDHLRSLSTRGIEISNEAARCMASDADATPGERVARGVERVTRSLQEHVAFEEASSAAMRRVVESVQGIGSLVRDIEGIGTAVKIIALNALVETERAGQGGRVLAVLAQSMGGLAGEVVRRTADVSGLLQRISALAATLGGAAAGGEGSQGTAIAVAMGELSHRLFDLQHRLALSVEELHAGSRTLGAEIEGIARQVSDHLASAQALGEVAARLERLGREVAGHALPAGEAAGARESALRARYTMDAERAIHDRLLPGQELPAAPAASKPTDDLGSNVELF